MNFTFPMCVSSETDLTSENKYTNLYYGQRINKMKQSINNNNTKFIYVRTTLFHTEVWENNN